MGYSNVSFLGYQLGTAGVKMDPSLAPIITICANWAL